MIRKWTAFRACVVAAIVAGFASVSAGQCPSGPGGLAIVGGGARCATSATVTWNGVANAIAFDVARGTSADPALATVIATVGPATLSYVDSSALTNQRSYYFVRSRGLPSVVCQTGFSAWSAVSVFLSTPITGSTGPVSVQRSTCGEMRIGWNAVENATAYDLYRSATPALADAEIFAEVFEATTLVSLPENVAGHYVWVRPRNTCGSGPISPGAFITAPGGVTVTGINFSQPTCDQVTVYLNGVNSGIRVVIRVIQNGHIIHELANTPATSTVIVSNPIPGATPGSVVEIEVFLLRSMCSFAEQVLRRSGVLKGASSVSLSTRILTAGVPSSLNAVTVPASPVGVTYSWKKDGQPLSSDGGRITGLTSATLNFSRVKAEDVGEYQLTTTLTCSQTPAIVTSAVLAVRLPCRADHDQSGTLDIADVFSFLNGWFAGCP